MIYVHQPQLPITYLQLHYRHDSFTRHSALGHSLEQGDQEGGLALSPALRILTQRQVLRGTKRASRERFIRDVEQLGTEIILTHRRYAHSIGAVALSRTLPTLISLFQEALTSPALDEEQLEHSKRVYIAELESRYDDDHTMAWLSLMRRLHLHHPLWGEYSVEKSHIVDISTDQVSNAWSNVFDPKMLLPCITSDLSVDHIQELLSPIYTSGLQLSSQVDTPPPLPSLQESTLTLVHKPDRQQALLFIAHPTISPHHPQWLALQVAICALGGTFSSTLMQEVRVKRGLSYGAYAGIRGEANARFVCLNATPDAKNAVETLEVMLEVYGSVARGEITDEALLFAKDYLINAHPFSIETPAMRAGLSVSSALMGVNPSKSLDMPRWLRPLTVDEIRQAAIDHLSIDRLELLVFGDQEGPLKGLFETIKNVIPLQRRISVSAHDSPESIKSLEG